jgi:DNA-binding transcriptional LysR family regulator
MELQRRHMEVLVAIADSGSIHKAASRLGIAQPAVSRVLAEIERSVGARLFDRAASGSRPTPRCEALLAQARFLLRGLLRIDQIARGQPAAVRLGCIPRAMHTLMPFIVNAMPQAEDGTPALDLQVREDSSTVLLDAIRGAGLDFAVMRHLSGAAGIGPHLAVDRLYDERPLVITRAGHPLGRRRQIALSALLGQRWVLPSVETTTRAVLDQFYREQGLAPIRPVLETRSFESILALVSGTELLSLIPESIARQHQRAGLVDVLNVTPVLPGTAVLLVSDPQAGGDPTLAMFRRLVVDAAAQARKTSSLRP